VPERDPSQPPPPANAFIRNVDAQEKRKLWATRTNAHVWSGLGLFGVIGWSIAGPTLLGVLLGTWLERRHPGTHSWTMILLVAGLCLGCANAWHWILKEQNAIHREGDDR
jgi:ATP synthase protein I